jgi:hypothetical protein
MQSTWAQKTEHGSTESKVQEYKKQQAKQTSQFPATMSVIIYIIYIVPESGAAGSSWRLRGSTRALGV